MKNKPISSSSSQNLNPGWSDEQLRAWDVLDMGPMYLERFPAANPEAEQETVGELSQAPRDWQQLKQVVADCRACELCESRTQTVFASGSPKARVLIVGEAPGEEEDRTGEPFVGQAGKLLTQMLKSIGLDRQTDVVIVNALKCRPPANRIPSAEELAACLPFLREQLELIRPTAILLTGRFACLSLLGSEESIAVLREKKHQLTLKDGTLIPTQVSYHPAYFLRKLSEKAKGWQDLLKLKALLP